MPFEAQTASDVGNFFFLRLSELLDLRSRRKFLGDTCLRGISLWHYRSGKSDVILGASKQHPVVFRVLCSAGHSTHSCKIRMLPICAISLKSSFTFVFGIF